MGNDTYGFVLWLSGFGLWISYIGWAFIPDEVLKNEMGITWYPSKYWALAIPIYVCVSLLAASILYTFYNMTTVARKESRNTVQDDIQLIHKLGVGERRQVFDLVKETPIIGDMTIEESTKFLYTSPDTKKTKRT